jgi:glutamate--cysteine ligase
MPTATIPPFNRAVNDALNTLTAHLITCQTDVEAWLKKQQHDVPTPLYTSVDIRHASFKIAPVDTNLFPGGFNNLHPDVTPQCIQAINHTLGNQQKGNRILLIPENHTRNHHYFDNIVTLQTLLTKAGYHVRIGSLLPDLNKKRTLNLPSGQTITLEPIKQQDNTLQLNDFVADFVILNHDLSDTDPNMFAHITQPILPSIHMGWSSRTKTQHFDHYSNITQQFAQAFDFDPWLITPMHNQCNNINFNTQTGMSQLKQKVTDLLAKIGQHYQQHHIEQKPFVAIKANTGTYGMAVMMVHDPEQLEQLNKKQRKQMSASKSGQAVNSVIIQEGVPTIETWHDSVAEPVIYAIGHDVVGGFYRIHDQKDPHESLNAPGMAFHPLPCPQACNNPSKNPCDPCNRFYFYGIITRLAILAAAHEQQAQHQENT